MAKYIVLISWTDQGIKTVKESPKRLDAARALAKTLGCELAKFYMTIGVYDLVAVVNAPDDETMAKLLLAIGATGNLRSTTLKAFSEAGFRSILAALP